MVGSESESAKEYENIEIRRRRYNVTKLKHKRNNFATKV